MARGFNVSDFYSVIGSKDLQRPNKFLTEFYVPSGLLGYQDLVGLNNDASTIRETVRTMEFWCESSAIPGVQLSTHDAFRYGYGAKERRATAPVFTDVNLAFIMDGESKIHDFFSTWIKMISNYDMRNGPLDNSGYISGGFSGVPRAVSAYELAYREDYVTDVNIYTFDQEGNVNKVITLREAYPVGMADTPVSWSDNNTYARLQVSLTFVDWFIQENT